MNSLAHRLLAALVLAHTAASLVHFVHNAAFLGDYPNMPVWISPAAIYGVWLAEAAVGVLGLLLLLRGRKAGLVLIVVYALLGLGGLDHYTLAPVSAHTLAMNATIWLETATAIALLVVAIGSVKVRWGAVGAVLLAIVICTAAPTSSHATESPGPRIVPIAPLSQDTEVLYGDPDVAGEPFVMRIRELPGTIIPPHKHPVDEHLTVVQGTLYFAVADQFDLAALKEIKAGGYAFIPKGRTMFGYIPDGAIVQVHGTGPFRIHWRAGKEWRDESRTLDDADSRSIFKFAKGDEVIAKRGRGRIRQGYFSGEILQYEVEGADGGLFMANEEELRRR
jgi:quercetin dioxygenase-like cupin family protein